MELNQNILHEHIFGKDNLHMQCTSAEIDTLGGRASLTELKEKFRKELAVSSRLQVRMSKKQMILPHTEVAKNDNN